MGEAGGKRPAPLPDEDRGARGGVSSRTRSLALSVETETLRRAPAGGLGLALPGATAARAPLAAMIRPPRRTSIRTTPLALCSSRIRAGSAADGTPARSRAIVAASVRAWPDWLR